MDNVQCLSLQCGTSLYGGVVGTGQMYKERRLMDKGWAGSGLGLARSFCRQSIRPFNVRHCLFRLVFQIDALFALCQSASAVCMVPCREYTAHLRVHGAHRQSISYEP